MEIEYSLSIKMAVAGNTIYAPCRYMVDIGRKNNARKDFYNVRIISAHKKYGGVRI